MNEPNALNGKREMQLVNYMRIYLYSNADSNLPVPLASFPQRLFFVRPIGGKHLNVLDQAND